MLVTKTLLFLGAAVIATAFTIPKGEANGFYLAYYDIEGNEVHKLITDISANLTESSISQSAKIGKRGQTWCGCRNGMDHGTTDDVNGHLGNILGNGYSIPGNAASYYVEGPSVAFMCNKDSFSATVNQGMIPTGCEKITAACGLYVAGTYRIDGLPAMDFGYMDYTNGEDFCRNAEGSGSHSC
ncbi:hypothetical protein N431DRAFT_461176 [Stipitochalara longipes BDJ]|nr:hypothetical protein N431DRAFT_461176 [Stipitochalara longipes BDJ]